MADLRTEEEKLREKTRKEFVRRMMNVEWVNGDTAGIARVLGIEEQVGIEKQEQIIEGP